MANLDKYKVEHLVVDSGAFIRNIEVKDIGRNIYSIHDVVNEIRDKTTRQRLQVLPYDIHFKEPSQEAHQNVINFSKKTGDFVSLSGVDLKLMSLVYQLEKEIVGTEHIRLEPTGQAATWQTNKNMNNPAQFAGIYMGKKVPKDSSETASESNGDISQIQNEDSQRKEDENSDRKETEDGEKQEEEKNDVLGSDMLVNPKTEEELERKDVDEEEPEDDEEDFDEDDDDEEGWITPENVASMKLASNDVEVEPTEVIPVACLTTDFAMQNVLLQMGLNVISVDGLLIKRAKSYVLRCYGCYKINSDLTRTFCYKCGNPTLSKVSMTVNSDGTVQYYLSSRKPITARGQRYSLPTPKGGKRAQNPILSADQKISQGKRTQAHFNVFDPDFVARDSPFAHHNLSGRSTFKSSNGQNQSHGRRNPNENNKLHGRRK